MRYVVLLSLCLFAINSFADNANLQTLLHTYKAISPDYLISSQAVYQSEITECKAIAYFAALIVKGKEQGISYNEARKFADSYSMENPEALEVVRQIYEEDFAKHLTVKGAYSGYGVDCDVQKNLNSSNN